MLLLSSDAQGACCSDHLVDAKGAEMRGRRNFTLFELRSGEKMAP